MFLHIFIYIITDKSKVYISRIQTFFRLNEVVISLHTQEKKLNYETWYAFDIVKKLGAGVTAQFRWVVVKKLSDS